MFSKNSSHSPWICPLGNGMPAPWLHPRHGPGCHQERTGSAKHCGSCIFPYKVSVSPNQPWLKQLLTHTIIKRFYYLDFRETLLCQPVLASLALASLNLLTLQASYDNFQKFKSRRTLWHSGKWGERLSQAHRGAGSPNEEGRAHRKHLGHLFHALQMFWLWWHHF